MTLTLKRNITWMWGFCLESFSPGSHQENVSLSMLNSLDSSSTSHLCLLWPCMEVISAMLVLTEQQFRPVGGGGTQGLLLGHPSPTEVILRNDREGLLLMIHQLVRRKPCMKSKTRTGWIFCSSWHGSRAGKDLSGRHTVPSSGRRSFSSCEGGSCARKWTFEG